MLNKLNNAINEVFLGGRFESRPLYLVLDNQGRKQLASILGIHPSEVDDHCCSVVGAALSKTGDPFSGFEQELWKWTLSGRKTRPPFTALLFVLSHAAELMVTDGEFTSGNYYDRLSSLVNVSAKKLSQNRDTTERFWRSFNGWLADNDFVYGRPTARAINGYKFVGIAMSQAIVREADRQKFHQMFEKYSFTNTDEPSLSEIEQYVSSWILTSQPTKQLKEAWKKTDLRPRICEAALSELEEWQAERPSGSDGTQGVSRLSLGLSIRHDFFGRTLALYFGKEMSLDPLQLTIAGSGEIELSNTTFAGFATLEPRSSIPLADALIRGLDLERDGTRALKWSGRPAIPLSRSDQGYWSEVSRVSLGIEHLVLVRDDSTIRKAIEGALEEAAAPGYTLATPGNLKGLPRGWVLYEKVVIKRALAELVGFEAVLSPVGEVASLRLEGGLKLGRGIYHRRSSPIATFEGLRAGVSISAWEGTSAEGKVICSSETQDTTASLELRNCVPESGNLYVEGRVGRTTMASTSLLFRSADRPRPLDRQGRSIVMSHDILAATTNLGQYSQTVRGLSIPALNLYQPNTAILSVHSALEKPAEQDQKSRVEGDAGNALIEQVKPIPTVKPRTEAEFEALPCAVRGRHLLKYAYEPPGTSRYAPVDVHCKDCDVTYLHRRPRPTAKGGTQPKARAQVPLSPIRDSGAANPTVSYDLWLDSACFLGSGSAAAFETFAASTEVDTWRAGFVMRDLSWLGHLDIEMGQTHRPKLWSISPPLLSMTGPKTAVLAGFRCDVLVESLRKEVEKRRGYFSARTRANNPVTVRVEGLDAGQLEELASNLKDPHGRSLEVVSDAPEAILAFLQGSAGIAGIFRPVSLGNGVPLERFDVAKNRWREVENLRGAGAYRVKSAGTSYVYLAPSLRAFSGPHELVKLAAARAVGAKLHAYDKATSTFMCWTGCEPPGLLGRALVGCSGYLPKIEHGITTFIDVRPGVAAGVLQLLYEGELPA